MKTKILMAFALVFALGAFTSCNQSYDKKTASHLAEKVDEDDVKASDYIAMVEQSDGLIAYLDDELNKYAELDSKDKRCDKFESLVESDEAEWCTKLVGALLTAKEDNELKGEARDAFSDKQIKSRYRALLKRVERQARKCND